MYGSSAFRIRLQNFMSIFPCKKAVKGIHHKTLFAALLSFQNRYSLPGLNQTDDQNNEDDHRQNVCAVGMNPLRHFNACLLYTSDAADDDGYV